MKNGFELVIEKLIPASREQAYQTWTSRLSDWWGPHGMTTPVCEMDLQPGGIFHTVMRTTEGQEYPNTGVFLEVVPNERIVFSDAFTPGWIPNPEPFMTAIFTFEEVEGGTLVTGRAHHRSEEDKAKHEAMGFHTGWGEMMERFEVAATK